MDIILATSSPRRINLLKMLNIKFKTVAPRIKENINETDPEKLVKKLSKLKALSIKEKGIIISADTIVYHNNKVLGKPKNLDNAFNMLKELSSKWHTVYTGVTIIEKDDIITFCEKTMVKFKKLSDELIRYYISTSKPLDKAGAYGIQELGAILVEKIEGDYYNVVGLPISRIWDILWDRRII
ncbi:septum formation inhibitor Maf [Thermosipho melanesiensis]|uniref:dTTP/UTP pyrophosphatase n=2 Tax=Thermosipho melanesiensis TaxID=46541 RepID=NTPPA_THEM4|nr:Maf family protein [Thermosipho melanesiensis]A6LJI7.1 RecName: Full=dTTP/UTP pyrophosphatase; Short=dTTPase/UTPase; AltName: Full=Nucleoside triphosphate pyrophosphatase; AltName: Full=Nucleotide pyrophosphatase; Short=Nucleotide PPase [Thermosipho melanesiensis BI429]ABR30088.1 maf protein [Thermosipho melanesiensis BI429]APT73285.1 septum formation inhibitor Maf [Thermosipho melanesiensis]OOC38677.1 septum formation inhibitor Maf [Thermosipho melanesiensis]OOC40481.1 septum formation inh